MTLLAIGWTPGRCYSSTHAMQIAAGLANWRELLMKWMGSVSVYSVVFCTQISGLCPNFVFFFLNFSHSSIHVSVLPEHWCYVCVQFIWASASKAELDCHQCHVFVLLFFLFCFFVLRGCCCCCLDINGACALRQRHAHFLSSLFFQFSSPQFSTVSHGVSFILEQWWVK